MSIITRQAVDELARLYEKRETLQHFKEAAADLALWSALANGLLSTDTTLSKIMYACGGTAAFADFAHIAIPRQIEEVRSAIDKEITALGGEI